jgi:carboxylesterase type B
VFNLKDFANAHPEIILVSINYRLGVFGYPNTPALSRSDTNAGLRDQRLAVEWVHKNIAAFGGDPNRIVLGGQSAGSGSTSAYLYAHPKDSLLSGAIMMSGHAGGVIPANLLGGTDYGPNPLPVVANATGCPLEGNDWTRQLDCLRAKSSKELIDAVVQTNALNIFPFADNRTVFEIEDYRSRGISGKFAKVV